MAERMRMIMRERERGKERGKKRGRERQREREKDRKGRCRRIERIHSGEKCEERKINKKIIPDLPV